MANVFDAAKYILEKLGRLTTMKLQKLCYYAQAWSLVWDETELFPEEFEAWANGPVCRALFNWHTPRFTVEAGDLPEGYLSGQEFTTDQTETLDAVIRDYGDKEANWLSALTHMEAPWQKARKGCPPGAYCSNVIEKGDMAWYYESIQQN